MRRTARFALIGLIASLALPAWADTLDVEQLVREIYYEGIPYERTQGLDDADIARLGTLLNDADESAHHGNIVMVLGMSGHRDAFQLLAAFGRQRLEGEVDRDTFRARTRLAQAMGHLARSDHRALRWLLQRADRPRPRPPAWSFRHHAGDALSELLHEQILTGLALSGHDEADRRLRRAERDAAGNDTASQRRRRHAQHARRTHQRIVEHGPDAMGEEVTR